MEILTANNFFSFKDSMERTIRVSFRYFCFSFQFISCFLGFLFYFLRFLLKSCYKNIDIIMSVIHLFIYHLQNYIFSCLFTYKFKYRHIFTKNCQFIFFLISYSIAFIHRVYFQSDRSILSHTVK